MSDLDLASTDALIEELSRRFDHGAVILLRVLVPATGKEEVLRRWFGNTHTVMGLMQDLALMASLDLRDRCQESEHPEGMAS
jgi:hypothetical protein